MKVLYAKNVTPAFAKQFGQDAEVWKEDQLSSTDLGRIRDPKLCIYAHSAGSGAELSLMAPEPVAARLASLYGSQKAELKDVYLIACEAGISTENKMSTAQKLAVDLETHGFTGVKVHAISGPTDKQFASIRVQTLEQAGIETKISDRKLVEDGVILRRRKDGDILTFTINGNNPADLLVPPTEAGSFQAFWDLPHNTFTKDGPQRQATLHQIQVLNHTVQIQLDLDKQIQKEKDAAISILDTKISTYGLGEPNKKKYEDLKSLFKERKSVQEIRQDLDRTDRNLNAEVKRNLQEKLDRIEKLEETQQRVLTLRSQLDYKSLATMRHILSAEVERNKNQNDDYQKDDYLASVLILQKQVDGIEDTVLKENVSQFLNKRKEAYQNLPDGESKTKYLKYLEDLTVDLEQAKTPEELKGALARCPSTGTFKNDVVAPLERLITDGKIPAAQLTSQPATRKANTIDLAEQQRKMDAQDRISLVDTINMLRKEQCFNSKDDPEMTSFLDKNKVQGEQSIEELVNIKKNLIEATFILSDPQGQFQATQKIIKDLRQESKSKIFDRGREEKANAIEGAVRNVPILERDKLIKSNEVRAALAMERGYFGNVAKKVEDGRLTTKTTSTRYEEFRKAFENPQEDKNTRASEISPQVKSKS